LPAGPASAKLASSAGKLAGLSETVMGVMRAMITVAAVHRPCAGA
jgi:hypothetical protein